MKKLLIIIFLLILCGNAYANDSGFVFISREDGIKLLRGEKSISILLQSSSDLKDKLGDDVLSDIKLKLQLIGIEMAEHNWGVPFLAIKLNLIRKKNNLYAGEIALLFMMTAELRIPAKIIL